MSRQGNIHIKQSNVEVEDPERKLALAIIFLAFNDLRNRSELIREDAKAWFRRKESNYLFSFHRICDHLNINREAAERFLKERGL